MTRDALRRPLVRGAARSALPQQGNIPHLQEYRTRGEAIDLASWAARRLSSLEVMWRRKQLVTPQFAAEIAADVIDAVMLLVEFAEGLEPLTRPGDVPRAL